MLYDDLLEHDEADGSGCESLDIIVWIISHFGEQSAYNGCHARARIGHGQTPHNRLTQSRLRLAFLHLLKESSVHHKYIIIK